MNTVLLIFLLHLLGIVLGCIILYIYKVMTYKNMVKDYYRLGGDKEVISFDEYLEKYRWYYRDIFTGIIFAWEIVLLVCIVSFVCDAIAKFIRYLFKIEKPKEKTIQELRKEQEERKPKLEKFNW